MNRKTSLFLNCVLFLMCFFLYFHKVILVTTMLDQFSLTAMAVNYTRAQTQHGPLASQRFVINKTIKMSEPARDTPTMLVLSL